MKAYLIGKLVEALFSFLGPEELEELADKVIDFAEDKAAAMDPGPYRSVIEGLCKNIRDAFQIEDNDDA